MEVSFVLYGKRTTHWVPNAQKGSSENFMQTSSQEEIRDSWGVGRTFTGSIIVLDEIAYFKDGLLHRIDGPAITSIYNSNSYKILWNKFCLEGCLFQTKEDWFNALTVEEKMEALFNINEWR